MTGLKLQMTEQMVLAKVIGDALAQCEKRILEAEMKHLSSALNHAKGEYRDLYVAFEKISQALWAESEGAGKRFIQDTIKAQQEKYAILLGDLQNA